MHGTLNRILLTTLREMLSGRTVSVFIFLILSLISLVFKKLRIDSFLKVSVNCGIAGESNQLSLFNIFFNILPTLISIEGPLSF